MGMHVRGKFFIALSCFCTLGHGEASGERVSLDGKISLKERLWLYQRRNGKSPSGEKSGIVKLANISNHKI